MVALKSWAGTSLISCYIHSNHYCTLLLKIVDPKLWPSLQHEVFSEHSSISIITLKLEKLYLVLLKYLRTIYFQNVYFSHLRGSMQQVMHKEIIINSKFVEKIVFNSLENSFANTRNTFQIRCSISTPSAAIVFAAWLWTGFAKLYCLLVVHDQLS